MLNVGIIGLGVGEAHIKGYEAHPGCRVVALCDFEPEVAKQSQIKYPQKKVCTKAEEILKDPSIQVVSIASFDNHHYSQIIEAIANDKHLFVEKPLCLFDYEARKIREALTKKPHLKISSNLILRKSPRFIELKKRIKEGRMGTLFHIEGDYNYGRLHKITEGWRGKIDFYSIVLGGGIHIIDLLQWLSDDKIVTVGAFGNNITTQSSQFKFNDTVTCILKFESKMTGKMTVNFSCVHPHFHALSVFGTNATFFNGRHEGEFFTSRAQQDEPQKVIEAYPGIQKGDFLFNFIEGILNNKEPEVSCEDIFRSLSVGLAIEKSVNEGKIIQVDFI